MDIDAFAELVAEALESLPQQFLDHLENIQIDVAEWPTKADLEEAGLDPGDRTALLGLYHGVMLTERTSSYSALPDRITLYQKPIELHAGPDEESIREQVRATVIHEIGHYFGLEEEDLEKLGWG